MFVVRRQHQHVFVVAFALFVLCALLLGAAVTFLMSPAGTQFLSALIELAVEMPTKLSGPPCCGGGISTFPPQFPGS